MYNKGLFIRGLLVVSVIGLLCGYALAAQQSGQNEPNKPATSDRTTSPPAAGTTGQTTQPTAGIGGQAAQQPMQLVKGSELIGKKLINTQNEDLGTIHDLVLTPDYKQVSYAALARGGVFGLGSKLFAIPWNAIKVGAEGKLTANISKETLDQSPGFKDDNWPSQADSRLGGAGMMGATAGRSSTQTGQPSAYGNRAQEPNAATSRDRTQGMAAAPGAESSRMASTAANTDIQNRRVSKLTGMSVKNPKNQDIGDVEDFVIDVPNGQVAYTIVSFGGFWGIGEKYVAVPAAAVDFQPRQGFTSINADRQALESVAFDPGNWPDLTNREYAQRLREAFKGEQPYRSTLGYVAPGQPQASSQTAWGAQGEYVKHFDPNQITTIKGTVQSIGTFEPAKGVSEGLRLRVKTADGKTITVHAGPTWYARQQKFDIKPGDEVTITGSNAKIGWRSVFIASEIQSGTSTLRLLSKTGAPLWTQAPMGQRPQGQPRSQTGQQPPRI